MIKIRNLKFSYSGQEGNAVDDITLDIAAGKYIAILGHNGSGKSTLSKILVGLYKPQEGEIWIDDILMSKKSMPEIRSKIGMVFQNPENQFIGSTVEDDIAFGLENKRISRPEMQAKVREYANKVHMIDYLDHEPQSLSGGQKQKVAIASTLALDPAIIIFDEVTSMLDPKGKADVIEIIAGIKAKGDKTLISVTHDMDEAILADEVIVLTGGKLLAKGKPSEILSNLEVVHTAKIDAPFIYKVSQEMKKYDKKFKETFVEEELIGALCK